MSKFLKKIIDQNQEEYELHNVEGAYRAFRDGIKKYEKGTTEHRIAYELVGQPLTPYMINYILDKILE